MRGELAGHLERERPDARPGELGEEPSEHLGERQVRRDGAGRLRGEQRGVDGVACGPAIEHVEDLLGDLLGDRDLGLGGRRPEVRGQDRVRGVEQRRVGRRLVLEDVDPGAAEPAVARARRRAPPRRRSRRGRR